MLTPKNNLFPIRNDILARVAASFFADRFAHIDDVPAQVLPDGSQCYHCNIENDRDIVRQICMAVLGFSPADEEGSKRPLHDYAAQALKRENWNRAKSRLSTPPAWPAAKNVILSAISAAPALPAPARLTARKTPSVS